MVPGLVHGLLECPHSLAAGLPDLERVMDSKSPLTAIVLMMWLQKSHSFTSADILFIGSSESYQNQAQIQREKCPNASLGAGHALWPHLAKGPKGALGI